MKLNQDFPIRILRPVPRSPITFVQQYQGLSIHLEGEAFGYRNSGLLSSIVARMLIGVNLKKVGLEDLDGGKEKRKVQLS
ncbi:MAG TPA: hypothetical protein V6D30_18360 [Leptolyngbyaceae cyanobacterium]